MPQIILLEFFHRLKERCLVRVNLAHRQSFSQRRHFIHAHAPAALRLS